MVLRLVFVGMSKTEVFESSVDLLFLRLDFNGVDRDGLLWRLLFGLLVCLGEKGSDDIELIDFDWLSLASGAKEL